MTGTDIAVIGGVIVVLDVAKDVAVYLIQKGLGRNGNSKHCPDHGCVITDIAEVKTDVKWIRDAISNHQCVRGFDPRD